MATAVAALVVAAVVVGAGVMAAPIGVNGQPVQAGLVAPCARSKVLRRTLRLCPPAASAHQHQRACPEVTATIVEVVTPARSIMPAEMSPSWRFLSA